MRIIIAIILILSVISLVAAAHEGVEDEHLTDATQMTYSDWFAGNAVISIFFFVGLAIIFYLVIKLLKKTGRK